MDVVTPPGMFWSAGAPPNAICFLQKTHVVFTQKSLAYGG
jgi:hypothetical protein